MVDHFIRLPFPGFDKVYTTEYKISPYLQITRVWKRLSVFCMQCPLQAETCIYKNSITHNPNHVARVKHRNLPFVYLYLCYLLPYLHTYLITYLPTNLHTYLCTYIHTHLLTYLCTSLPTSLLYYLFTSLPTYLPTYRLTYLHMYFLTYFLALLLVYFLTYPPTYLLN